MKKPKVRIGKNEKDMKQIITLITEVTDAKFTSNNEIKTKYLENDVKHLINYIKTLEKNLSLNKEIINQLCSQNKKDNENLKIIEKLNSENISLMVKVKELTKEKEEFVPKILIYEQIIEDQKRKETEDSQELSNRITEITELLNKKEYLLQAMEKKYYTAESLLKKYSYKDPEIRAKLRDMNINPQDEKKISNVVEENEELRKQIKELYLKIETLEKKIEQISTSDSLKSISGKNLNFNNKTGTKAIAESSNIPNTSTASKNPSNGTNGIIQTGEDFSKETKIKDLISNYKNLQEKFFKVKDLIIKLITIYDEYNLQTFQNNPSQKEENLDSNANKQYQQNRVLSEVNDIIKDIKAELIIQKDLNEPDFIDLNLNSPNIYKEKVEENNFWNDGENLSSIEKELDNEEKEDNQNRQDNQDKKGKQDKKDKQVNQNQILDAPTEIEDKNEKITIAKNS